MSRDELEFDGYISSVNSVSEKRHKEGVVYDLYKMGVHVLDAVDILEGEFLTKEEIKALNKKCSYVLNTLISKHDIDSLEGCLSFTNEFMEKGIKEAVKKLSIISCNIDETVNDLVEKTAEYNETSDYISKVVFS